MGRQAQDQRVAFPPQLAEDTKGLAPAQVAPGALERPMAADRIDELEGVETRAGSVIQAPGAVERALQGLGRLVGRADAGVDVEGRRGGDKESGEGGDHNAP